MWYPVLGAVIGIYLLINLALGEVFSGFVATYVAQPILWALLAILVLRLPRERAAGKASWRDALIVAALMAGVLHIVLLVTAGFIEGFGNSPYSFTPRGIITNMFYVGSALVGVELSRAYLINSLSRRYATLVIALVALLYAALAIPMRKFTGVAGAEETVIFLGATCLPLVATSLLASFLAYLGGPVPAIAYSGIIVAFQWFSPILPDLPPMMTALFGTVAPIVGFALVQYGLLPAYTRIRMARKKRTWLPVGWIATGIVAVAIVWFALGLFSFRPMVIYSGSMSPALDVGDVAIVIETSPDEINIGDIIEYRTEEDTIIHRVIDVQEGEEGRVFITQGDANSSPDSDPVAPGQITGRVVFTLPKVGWVAVGVKSLFSSSAEND